MSNDIFIELLQHKLPNSIFSYDNILNLSKRIKHSIFTEECSAYETKTKTMYPACYIKGIKKIQLIKAVYTSFVRPLLFNEYLHPLCTTKCCICINHYKVLIYKTKKRVSTKKYSYKNVSLTIIFD